MEGELRLEETTWSVSKAEQPQGEHEKPVYTTSASV